MSNIIFFKGQSQYDVATVFVDQWAQAFRDLGHQVQIVDFLSNCWQSQLAEFINPSADCVIAFNSIGCDLRIGKVSPFDQFDIRYVPVMLNHPIQHRGRLNYCANRLPICTDRNHLSFIETHTPELVHPPIFMPHAACIGGAKSGKSEKNLETVFCGSGVDPDHIRGLWVDIPDSIRPIVLDTADIYLADPQRIRTVDQIAVGLLEESGFEPESDPYETVITVLRLVDSYVRAVGRLDALKLLDKNRIPVQIFGSGWEFADFKRHTIHESQPFPDMLNTMNSARLVLDVSPDTLYGSNERVLSAMAQGLPVLATANGFYDHAFSSDELHTWRNTEPEILPELARDILAKPDLSSEQAQAGRQAVLGAHTWQHRAETLLKLLSQTGDPAVSAA